MKSIKTTKIRQHENTNDKKARTQLKKIKPEPIKFYTKVQNRRHGSLYLEHISTDFGFVTCHMYTHYVFTILMAQF